MYFGYDFPEEREENKKNETDFISEIKQVFPEVVIEDAYDDIKGFRRTVILSDDKELEYNAWLIAFGWYGCSFKLGIMMLDKDKETEVDMLIDLAKTKYPDHFKKD